MMIGKIAVLLTCFNRKEKTILSLKKLYQFSTDFEVYLVDDGSTDGTSEAVSNLFPEVNILKGNGELFWCRGMLLAWETASLKDYDFYVWLNDDVYLYDNAFDELFQCSNIFDNKAIISGLVEDQEKKVIYGGFDENRKLIQVNGKTNKITNLNGNIVLVPKYVFQKIGMFDEVFHHDLGDVEYGLRAISEGVAVVTTREAIALGDRNPIVRERLWDVNFRNRFRRLYSPLGSNPYINFYFRRKYKSYTNAIFYFAFQHFINALPDDLYRKMFKS